MEILVNQYYNRPLYLEDNTIELEDLNKIYSIIDQQKARHFVQYSVYLSNPPSLQFK